jgi:hypothetical protein
MQATMTRAPGVPVLLHILEILTAFLVLGVLTHTPLPLIGNDRVAFYALALVGIAGCGLGGIAPTAARRGWAHPIGIVGIALGVVALALIVAVLIGQTTFLNPLGIALYGDAAPVLGDRVAFIALASVMAVKWVVSVGQQRAR